MKIQSELLKSTPSSCLFFCQSFMSGPFSSLPSFSSISLERKWSTEGDQQRYPLPCPVYTHDASVSCVIFVPLSNKLCILGLK